MFRVLLVDDNYLAVEHLKNEIDWKPLGFDRISIAYDGKEALKLYKQYRQDLILTDISMPGMDGIELARHIMEIDPNVLIVFISSYEEFSYARSALNIGVYDYILKHEFIGSNLNNKIAEYKQIVEKNAIQSQKSREEKLLALLKDEGEKQHVDKDFPDEYDLFLIEQNHCLPVLSELFQVDSIEMEGEQLASCCYETSDNICTIAKVGKYVHAVLLSCNDGEDRNRFLYTLKDQLNECFHSAFSVFLFCRSKTIGQCQEAYRKLKNVVLERYFLGTSIVWNYIYYQPLKPKKWDMKIDCMSRLMNKSSDEMGQYIDETYYEAILEKDYLSFSEITKTFAEYLKEYDGKLTDIDSGEKFRLTDKMSSLRWHTAADVVFWIKQKYEEFIAIQASNSQFQYSEDVQWAVQYIYENYQNADLSIEQIASSTNLGVNRLNVLFRKETKQTIGKFLSNYRMQKAKECILNNHKITKIHSLVGYSTPQYFTTVFKNEFGITPYEFRKENQHDE